LLRRQGLDSLPVTFQRRRIYILPTRAGVGFSALILTMLVAGLNYTNSTALFLTFLLSGFALVAMHQCHRNLLNVKLTDTGTTSAFAGERGKVAVTLANESRMPRYRLELSALEKKRSAVVDVEARSSRRLELSVPTVKRGLMELKRLNVATSHPFGLFRAWTWVHLPVAITVFPRPQGAKAMPFASGLNPGPAIRGGAGEDEWLGLRPFRDGDSPRQVAWKAYARGMPLLVKEYGSTGSDLRLFNFNELGDLDLEARLEQLARWIVEAEDRGERYGLAMPDQTFEPDQGPEHRQRCLTALALFGVRK
jgi:uncharacterized protein (DUF58 family)